MKPYIYLLNPIYRTIYYKLFYPIKYPDLNKRNVILHPESFIGHNTTIGDYTICNGHLFISSHKDAACQIGKYGAFSGNLKIFCQNHSIDYPNFHFYKEFKIRSMKESKGNVVIGNSCWIGDSVIILAGVSIGDGAVIGSGSIVTKDVPPFSIFAGNPAKFIKYRFPEALIKQLIDIAWWNWDSKKIKKNKKFFELNLNKYCGHDVAEIIK